MDDIAKGLRLVENPKIFQKANHPTPPQIQVSPTSTHARFYVKVISVQPKTQNPNGK